jgi:hypothetical protein
MLCITCTDTRVLCGPDLVKCYYYYGTTRAKVHDFNEVVIALFRMPSESSCQQSVQLPVVIANISNHSSVCKQTFMYVSFCECFLVNESVGKADQKLVIFTIARPAETMSINHSSKPKIITSFLKETSVQPLVVPSVLILSNSVIIIQI